MAVNADAILFLPSGLPTYLMLAAWRTREPVIPLQAGIALLESDRTASDHFRSIWQAAFPDRDALPTEPLADGDGRGTDALWNVFS